MNKPTRYRGQSLVDLSDSAVLPPQPATVPPAPRAVYHNDECSCEGCCSIRASMDIYLKARKAYEANGFI